jgi:hypothetical protein
VIEVFAGSHPVGRHFQHLRSQQQPAPYSLAAYAAIEEKQPEGKKYRAPTAESLGLTPEHYLSLHTKVQDADARTELLDLMRTELHTSDLDGVVVFGGPPCEKFSNAGPQPEQRKAALQSAQDALEAAERRLEQLSQSQAAGGASSSAALEGAQRRVAEARSACDAAADAVVRQDDLDVVGAEAVVASFLGLFLDIKEECRKARMPTGPVPCHLAMENPYSTADKALWNR